MLGLVIEKVAARPYEEAVRAILLDPLRLDRLVLNHERGRGYRPGEAHRYGPKGAEDREGGAVTHHDGLGRLARPTV